MSFNSSVDRIQRNFHICLDKKIFSFGITSMYCEAPRIPMNMILQYYTLQIHFVLIIKALKDNQLTLTWNKATTKYTHYHIFFRDPNRMFLQRMNNFKAFTLVATFIARYRIVCPYLASYMYNLQNIPNCNTSRSINQR